MNVLFGSKRIGTVAKTGSSIVKVNVESILVIVPNLHHSASMLILSELVSYACQAN